MVKPDWQKVKGIVYEALSLPAPARAKFLDDECSHDSSLRSEVEILLDSYESGFLEASILESQPLDLESEPSLFAPGYSFSHYEIIKLLGRGGMGEVYLANDNSLSRLTAIKIIHSDSRLAESASSRLLREARAAAKVEHSCICSVYEVGETDGRPYIAMQYVVGESLDSLIAAGAVSTSDAIAYALQIAAALAKAHFHDLVHRDVKPANVIVDSEKKLKVLDFGLAEYVTPDAVDSVDAGLVAGTIAYMSPEHLRGEEVGFQTDIWGLGVLFYQMLTGRLPFSGRTRAELIDKILHQDFDDISTPDGDNLESVNLIVRRALEKDTKNRYQSIEDFAVDLDDVARRFATGSSVIFGQPTQIHKLRTYLITTGIVAILAAISVAVILKTQTRETGLFTDNSGNGFKIDSLHSIKRKGGGMITDLSFSPDGEHLAYALSEAGASSIYALSTVGEKPRRLTDGEKISDDSPVWSPDGSNIGFVSNRSGKNAVWIVASGGGNVKMLAEFPTESQFPKLRKWSNDGTKIFFDDGSGPKTIDLQTGMVATLDITGIEHRAIRGFSIVRDESAMIVTTTNNGKECLWYKTVGTNDARLLSDEAARNGTPAFFPNGDGYAYSADDNGRFQIYVRSLDGSPPKQLTFSNFSASNPAVSPNGEQIVYVSNDDQANIFRTNVSTGAHTMLTEKANMQLLPKVSPNGKYLAYQSMNESTEFLSAKLQIDLLGEAVAQSFSTVTRSGCCLEWTPNGEAVTYIHRNDAGFNIFKFDLNDRTETQLTNGGIASPSLSITPFGILTRPYDYASDGMRLVFAARRFGRDSILFIEPNGTESEIFIAENGLRAKSPIYLQDSDSIAFLDVLEPGAGSGKRPTTRVLVSTSGHVVTLAEFENEIILLDWSKKGDGVFVAVPSEVGYELVLIPIDPAASRMQLATLKNAKELGISMSPDNRAVSYSVLRNQVENVCVLDLSVKKERCLTSNEDPTFFYSGATWTPDSENLVYSRQTGGIEISLISRINE